MGELDRRWRRLVPELRREQVDHVLAIPDKPLHPPSRPARVDLRLERGLAHEVVVTVESYEVVEVEFERRAQAHLRIHLVPAQDAGIALERALVVEVQHHQPGFGPGQPRGVVAEEPETVLVADLDEVGYDLVGPVGLDVEFVADLAGEPLPQDLHRYSGNLGRLKPREAKLLHRLPRRVVHQGRGVRALHRHQAVLHAKVRDPHVEVADDAHVTQPALDLIRRDHVRVLRGARDQRILDDLSVLADHDRVHRLSDLDVGEVLPGLDVPHECVNIGARDVELVDGTPVADDHGLAKLQRLAVPTDVLVHDEGGTPLGPLLSLAGQRHLSGAGNEEHGSLCAQRKIRVLGEPVPVLVVGLPVASYFVHRLLTLGG